MLVYVIDVPTVQAQVLFRNAEMRASHLHRLRRATYLVGHVPSGIEDEETLVLVCEGPSAVLECLQTYERCELKSDLLGVVPVQSASLEVWRPSGLKRLGDPSPTICERVFLH